MSELSEELMTKAATIADLEAQLAKALHTAAAARQEAAAVAMHSEELDTRMHMHHAGAQQRQDEASIEAVAVAREAAEHTQAESAAALRAMWSQVDVLTTRVRKLEESLEQERSRARGLGEELEKERLRARNLQNEIGRLQREQAAHAPTEPSHSGQHGAAGEDEAAAVELGTAIGPQAAVAEPQETYRPLALERATSTSLHFAQHGGGIHSVGELAESLRQQAAVLVQLGQRLKELEAAATSDSEGSDEAQHAGVHTFRAVFRALPCHALPCHHAFLMMLSGAAVCRFFATPELYLQRLRTKVADDANSARRTLADTSRAVVDLSGQLWSRCLDELRRNSELLSKARYRRAHRRTANAVHDRCSGAAKALLSTFAFALQWARSWGLMLQQRL